jgi:predicted nucleotidyltransferase
LDIPHILAWANSSRRFRLPSHEVTAADELPENRGMLTLDTLRSARRDEILHLARQRGARDVRVFGSVARGEATESSDLDLLVTWEPGRSLLDHAGLVQDLQELLGVKVHVGTEKSLHWYVRDRILREATPL